MEFITGRNPRPPRIMIYGTAGVGKSTLAAHAPNPVFLDIEDRLGEIECQSFPRADATRYPVLSTVDDVLSAISDLYTKDHDRQTVILDTADEFERVAQSDVAKTHGHKHVEDFGYGKGYKFALAEWQKIMDGMNALRNDKNMMVIITAHDHVERFNHPETDPYDRFTPRLRPEVTELIKGRFDGVFFATRKVYTVTKEEGFGRKHTRATGGSPQPVLKTCEMATNIGKGWSGLPEEISMVDPAACMNVILDIAPSDTKDKPKNKKEEVA